MARIFISHSSLDKKFATKLATDLSKLGHIPWLDEWEIKVGECIPSKIEQGISESDYVVIVLSPNSTNSNWVEREWKSKYWDEVNENRVMVLPVLLSNCDIPRLLLTKKLADFRDNYSIGLVQLMGGISPVIPEEHSIEAIVSTGRSQEVSNLIAKVQSRDVPLSSCITEALNIAQKIGDSSLEEFCKGELTGWYRGERVKNKEDIPKYRLIEIFVSPFAQLNMQYFGWGENASNVFDYMRRDSENFCPWRMLFAEPVSELESRQPMDDIHKSIITVNMTLKDIVPDTNTPDFPVFGYGRADSYIRVLEGIRTELTQRLMELLPNLNEQDA